MGYLCHNTIAATLRLSEIEHAQNMLAIEKQLETTCYLCDDVVANVMVLSKIDCVYNMFATERQLEVT